MLETIRSAVWGMPTVLLLLSLGCFFCFRAGLLRISVLKSSITGLFAAKKSSSGGVSSFAAAATALGGTVGVGSIVGVGYAISVGGAGSIFWMWVSSLFGIGLKYAEVRAALNCGESKNGFALGGAHWRLRSLGHPILAVFFCVSCLLASFTTGNITQIGAISETLFGYGMKKFTVGLVCLVAVALSVFGGRRRIARLNSVIVPTAAVAYILTAILLLMMNISELPSVFRKIFVSAFGFGSAAGGFSGALLARGISEGLARSTFSNESGMGSSPLAHASVEGASGDAARLGIFEVVFDSFVVSTLTALCLLSCGEEGMSSLLFYRFGDFGEGLYALMLAVLAFASVISWCYYGECCIAYLFRGRLPFYIYRALFALCSFFGAYVSGGNAIALADICNALMTAPNIILLLLCRKEIERID